MRYHPKSWLNSKALAIVAAAVMVAPLAGCGSGGGSGSNMPPVDDSRPQTFGQPYGYQQPQRQGLSTGKKIAILAGAAALYYMYKKNKEKQQAGQLNGQPVYYLSHNGRVYYRDQSGRAHWVTPPQGGIQVPADEGQQYSQFQGYNNQSTGRDLTGLGIE